MTETFEIEKAKSRVSNSVVLSFEGIRGSKGTIRNSKWSSDEIVLSTFMSLNGVTRSVLYKPI